MLFKTDLANRHLTSLIQIVNLKFNQISATQNNQICYIDVECIIWLTD